VDGDVEDHLVHERLPVTLSTLQPVEEGVGQAVVAGDEVGKIERNGTRRVPLDGMRSRFETLIMTTSSERA